MPKVSAPKPIAAKDPPTVSDTDMEAQRRLYGGGSSRGNTLFTGGMGAPGGRFSSGVSLLGGSGGF